MSSDSCVYSSSNWITRIELADVLFREFTIRCGEQLFPFDAPDHAVAVAGDRLGGGGDATVVNVAVNTEKS